MMFLLDYSFAPLLHSRYLSQYLCPTSAIPGADNISENTANHRIVIKGEYPSIHVDVVEDSKEVHSFIAFFGLFFNVSFTF